MEWREKFLNGLRDNDFTVQFLSALLLKWILKLLAVCLKIYSNSKTIMDTLFSSDMQIKRLGFLGFCFGLFFPR